MKHILTTLLIAGALFLAGPAAAEVMTGSQAPGFSLKDTNGKMHSLDSFKGKYVVLEWINPDCPFVRKHYDSGNMQALQKAWTDKDVVWLTIQTTFPGHGQYYSPESLSGRLQKEKAAPTAILMDPDGKVGKAYDARTTPHMYVINPEGILIYQGAIDSKPSARASDVEGADNYVVMALEQAMAGKKISNPTTRPYGCSVKYGN